MNCPKCGKENVESAQFCAHCGEPLTANVVRPTPTGDEASVGPLGILFFCIPLVGAVMYFIWKDEKPLKAKKACNLALWGVGVGIVLNIISALIQASMQ